MSDHHERNSNDKHNGELLLRHRKRSRSATLPFPNAPASTQRQRHERDSSSDGYGATMGSSSPPPPAAASARTTTLVDRLTREDAPSLQSAQAFFDGYIGPRRPCIFPRSAVLHATNSRMKQGNGNHGNDTWFPTTEWMQRAIGGDCRVQVERRAHAQASFGQNRTIPGTQVVMTFDEFWTKLHGPDRDLYYVSTQMLDDGEDEDAADNNDNHDDDTKKLPAFKPSTSTPTDRLVANKYLPATLPLADTLVLESRNMWMGASSWSTSTTTNSMSSSGLHHDFHDNFYILLQGRKTFWLYPPSDYKHIPTYGTVSLLHHNGLLSYADHPTRADGKPLEMETTTSDDENDDEDDDEEESVVLGKGFDYQSDDDTEEENNVDWNPTGPDDYDDAVGRSDDAEADHTDAKNGSVKVKDDATNLKKQVEPKDDDENSGHAPTGMALTRMTRATTKTPTTSSDEHCQRPNHFSPVDPTQTDRSNLLREYPSFAKVHETVVHLEAGDCLYLPASWFHCVASSSSSSSASSSSSPKAPPSVHMAVNYWYHPPDRLDNYQDPYQDSFWRQHQKEVGGRDGK